MSLGLLEHTDSTEAFSDSEWKPREAKHRRAFERSARPPSSLCGQAWILPLANGELTFVEEPPGWLQPTIRQIANLCNLPPNWDSYGARPVDPSCVVAAINLLLRSMNAHTPLPTVVPLNRGGVQFEWHCNDVDLEFAISTPSRLRVAFEDLRTEESKELILTGDLQPALQCLQKLSQVR